MSNNSQPLVSIIVPAYNIERYLSQTLESIIHQTYQNLEIIVVNDGSKDGTLNIATDYAKKDSRVIIVSQTNKGLSAARNAGFKIATGEYICIIDADDIMMPEKISSQCNILQHHPSVDFTYSKVRYFINETHDIYIRDLATPDGVKIYKQLLRQGNFISPNAVFFRKNVFDTYGGFDESLRSAEDLDYWLFLSQKGVNFLHQDSYLTLCRARKDSLTGDNITLYSSVVRVFEKHLSGISKLTSMQYIKNRTLLWFAKIRKSNTYNKSLPTDSVSRKGFGAYLDVPYQFLRKIKFLLTFKKVHDKNAHDYLMMIETSKAL